MRERRTHLFRAVADDYDDFSDSGFLKIRDASLDDAPVAERQQRLELAHAPRAPGGEQNSRVGGVRDEG
jgi:nuclear transport factor 2 (NTF2) superfamily protein